MIFVEKNLYESDKNLIHGVTKCRFQMLSHVVYTCITVL